MRADAARVLAGVLAIGGWALPLTASGDAPDPRGRLAPVPAPIAASPGLVPGDVALPPWIEPGDVPPPAWVRSVRASSRDGTAIFAEPGALDARRGTAVAGARLPFFGARRAPGCQGRWLHVGPFAWVCSDAAEYAEDAPGAPPLGLRAWLEKASSERNALPRLEPREASDDGLPYRYYFAGRDGAYGYANLARALDDAADQELEPGFAVATTEEAVAHGEPWVRTTKSRWIAARELSMARPSRFFGTLVEDGKLDAAWIVADKTGLLPEAKASAKPRGMRTRFERVHVKGTAPGPNGGFVEVATDDGAQGFVRARDVAVANLAPPPDAVARAAKERWIDVDLAQQTLVAYEGETPVFATLVSTGKGPPGSDSVTRTGVHRIWVKLFTTKMDNLDKEDLDRHYAIEDVPWVQFFDKAIGLHAAFWHREFGRTHSHGCVNLAPIDARWLFAFTGPHLPAGWSAVLPAKVDAGTVVRVR